MPFPLRLLNEGEDIVLDLQPHWWPLVAPAVGVVAALALAVVVLLAGFSSYVLVLPVAVGALAVVVLVERWLRRRTTNFVLTTDRIIFRSGVVSKRGKEIPLMRIQDIMFNQSMFDRLIGAGDLMIESAGERGQEIFPTLPRPSRVQNAVYQEVERFRERQAERAAGRPPLSIPEQLEKLDELRQRGVLTQAEFDAKKAQLLDRL